MPNRQTFAEAWQVVLHDLGIRKQPLPRRKFNGAQRLAYTGVVAMGAGSLLTGLAIYKPVQLPGSPRCWADTRWRGSSISSLTVGYVAFFVIHITQVVRAGWNNFRAMVIGVEVVGDEEPIHATAGEREVVARS